MAPALESIIGTFSASIRSVGTACTLAAVGVYLHRQEFVVGSGKRTLALISQQVTFPLFLFTKIIYCNQDWSDDPCPDVTKSLRDVWMLLFWPIYVVGAGVAVGALVAFMANTPKSQVRTVLAACGFGNSTGLPITLLTVVHTNFPATSDLGRIDPTLFLSVYLLLYPVLQWGFGGWLLAPEDEDEGTHGNNDIETVTLAPPPSGSPVSETTPLKPRLTSPTLSDHYSFRHNVLNNKQASNYYQSHRHGLVSMDEGLYISEANLAGMGGGGSDTDSEARPFEARDETALLEGIDESFPPPPSPPSNNNNTSSSARPPPYQQTANGTSNLSPVNTAPTDLQRATSQGTTVASQYEDESSSSSWETCKNILNRCLQPPVIGAIAGIICAMTPARGVLVDLIDRSAHAPLQWLFDALYTVGQTAVPINMMILGCNLSASQQNHQASKETGVSSANLLSTKTMLWIVIGKMVIMPIVGIVSALLLRTYFWDLPDDIDGAFYLVLMIVFITPTANNVMVMVELSGSDTKEGLARVIALQYAVAPLILSLTMTAAIGVASDWS